MSNDQNNDNFIPISNNINAKLEKQDKEIKSQKSVLKWTHYFLITILIVCVIGYITFLLDAWRFHYYAYRDFNNQIKLMDDNKDNEKIDDILQEIEDVKNKSEKNMLNIEKIKKRFYIE